jgi:redox-sensing transcriptional repressor
MTGATPEQVRKDLSHFGAFGRRGVGYDALYLRNCIREIMGLDRPRRVIIIGAGHVGSALAGYPGFESRGFNIVAIYDNNPARIGHMVQGLRVRNIASLAEDCQAQKVDIAIIAVPEGSAQTVADQAVGAGIKALLSFAPTALYVPEDVIVRHVDMTAELEFLSFWLTRGRTGLEQAE